MKRVLILAALLLAAVTLAHADAGMAPQVGVTATPIVIQQPADTSISVGTLGAQLLEWFAAVFVPVVGAFLTKLLMALAQKAGVQATQAMSDKLDGIIENGIHNGANKLGADLSGKLTVTVKNQVAAKAVEYAQAHGADTIKGLTGVDPNDPKVVEALQARAAKALNLIGPDAVLSPIADKSGPTATAIATSSDALKTEPAAAPVAEKPPATSPQA